MAQLREIKNRIKAVGNIERITKTMQMIATAKFNTLVRRSQQTKPYTQKLAEIVAELATAGGELDHPLLRSPDEPAGKELLLVITSNRGLCGAYNANVLRSATQYMSGRQETTFELDVVGKKGLGYMRFAGYNVRKGHTHFRDQIEYEPVEQLGNEFIEQFEAGEYDAIRVAYMKFESNSRQRPEVIQLLPVQPPKAKEAEGGGRGRQAIYEFSPDPATLLGRMLPLTVKSRLFQCFNDAVVSEQIARMVAMKSATENAGDMRRQLRRDFNRARQAQITTELSEIIGGAAALS